MIGVFSAIVLVITFAFIDIIWKRLRREGVDTRAILALFVFSVPVLLAMGAFVDPASIHMSTPYLVYAGLFVFGNLILNVMNVYLFRYVSLTSIFSYRKSIALFFAILADVFFFNALPTAMRVAGIALMFFGGLFLTRNTQKRKDHLLPVATILLYMLVIGFLDTGLFTVYKKGLEMQASIIFHLIFVQSCMFVLFGAVGLRQMKEAWRRIPVKDIFFLNILVVIGAVAEIYTLYYYSISAIILISGIPLALYSFYDVKIGEWRLTPKNLGSLALIILGFALLNM